MSTARLHVTSHCPFEGYSTHQCSVLHYTELKDCSWLLSCCTGGLARVLQGVKSVIALGKLGSLLPAAQRAGVERVVLLSTAGEPSS